jgi:hypothetical protein
MEAKPVFYSAHYCKFLVPGANPNGNDRPSQERQAHHATYWHLGYATTTLVVESRSIGRAGCDDARCL